MSRRGLMNRLTDSRIIVTFSGDINVISLSCDSCIQYRGDDNCLAYPGGIPTAILLGEFDHTEPYPGDHGIQFEPVKES